MSPVQSPSTSARSQFHEEVNMFAGSAPGLKARERRRHQRFPINVSSRYLLDEARGYATTVNISSGGVLLNTKEILPVGRQVQLLIDWPALPFGSSSTAALSAAITAERSWELPDTAFGYGREVKLPLPPEIEATPASHGPADGSGT